MTSKFEDDTLTTATTPSPTSYLNTPGFKPLAAALLVWVHVIIYNSGFQRLQQQGGGSGLHHAAKKKVAATKPTAAAGGTVFVQPASFLALEQAKEAERKNSGVVESEGVAKNASDIFNGNVKSDKDEDAEKVKAESGGQKVDELTVTSSVDLKNYT